MCIKQSSNITRTEKVSPKAEVIFNTPIITDYNFLLKIRLTEGAP
jgi:hypothetical protein